MSGGVLYLGGGTKLQKACGYEDTEEAMFAYLKSIPAIENQVPDSIDPPPM